MVHKKSEYRLQFHILSKDLRQKIWEENIRFREFRRSVNQAHHYWSYQITDDPCVCDEVDQKCAFRSELKDDVPYTAEHAQEAEVSKTKHEVTVPSFKPKTGRQVQLREPEQNEVGFQEIGIQTAEWPLADIKDKRGKTSELVPLMENLHTSASEPNDQKKQTEFDIVPATDNCKSTSPEGVSHPRPPSVASRRESPKPSPQSNTGGSVSLKRYTPSRFSALSKTSRKCFFEERKSPFAFYGWNDADKNIGQKKTYNVCAPKREVHSPALRAQKRRREDIEKYLMKEVEQMKLSQRSKSPVNLSSIWMSEYQEKFSHGCKVSHGTRILRPVSAPTLCSPLGWRCR